MYDDENTTHYDYFDYLSSHGKSKQFEPDSDMDFIQFRDLMKKEAGSQGHQKFFGFPDPA